MDNETFEKDKMRETISNSLTRLLEITNEYTNALYEIRKNELNNFYSSSGKKIKKEQNK